MAPVKILTIGDPHFKVNNVRETDEMSAKILALIVELQPDAVVCLGDILDRHETIHVSPLMRATFFLQKIAEMVPLYIVIGNHDRPNNSNFLTNEHPFNALKEWHNTVVADCVKVAEIKGQTFMFVPYVPPGTFRQALDTVPNVKVSAIFAHQEFYGAKMGAIVSTVGDKWDLSEPLVISGHIHDFDVLQANVIYVGTPIQHAFGDRCDKTVSVFTFETGFEHQRIDLKVVRRLTVTVNTTEALTYVPPNNSIVKLIISGSAEEIQTFIKLRTDRIKQLNRLGIKVVYKSVNTSLPVVNKSTQSYTQRLHEAANESQRKWLNKLFGGFTIAGN